MNVKGVTTSTVKGDSEFLLYFGEGKDVSNAFEMKPNNSKTGQIANEVGLSEATSKTMELF